jgi:hypothetical protein
LVVAAAAGLVVVGAAAGLAPRVGVGVLVVDLGWAAWDMSESKEEPPIPMFSVGDDVPSAFGIGAPYAFNLLRVMVMGRFVSSPGSSSSSSDSCDEPAATLPFKVFLYSPYW